MPLSPDEFARRLVQLREDRVLDVADAAKIVGVSGRQWTRWEAAGTDQGAMPHSTNLHKILEAFELPASYLGIDEPGHSLLADINAKLDAIIDHLGIQLTAPAANGAVAGPPPGPLQQDLQAGKPTPRTRPHKDSQQSG